MVFGKINQIGFLQFNAKTFGVRDSSVLKSKIFYIFFAYLHPIGHHNTLVKSR